MCSKLYAHSHVTNVKECSVFGPQRVAWELPYIRDVVGQPDGQFRLSSLRQAATDKRVARSSRPDQ